MSQQNKQASTSTPADPPLKRKRGRPRKDESLVHKEKPAESPQPAPSDDVRTNQHTEFDPSDDIDNDMVGQVVSGVIEGSFDAGYFLSVRTGNTGTLLRGVVFQPGLFSPITAANDVAPQAKMYQRREFPIPVLNLHSQVDGSTSIPQPERNNEHPVRLENQAPTIPALVLPSELQSGSPSTLASPNARGSHDYGVCEGLGVSSHTPASKEATYVAKNKSDAFMGGKTVPKENSEFGLEKQSTPDSIPLTDKKDSPSARDSSYCGIWGESNVCSLTPAYKEAAFVTKKESDPFMKEKIVSGQNSEFGLKKQSATHSSPGPRDSSYCGIWGGSSTFMGEKTVPEQNSEFGLKKQSTPQTNTFLKIDPRKDLPQQLSEFGLENQSASWLQPVASFPSVNQSAFGKIPMTDYLCASLGAKNVPNHNSEFGLDNQFAVTTKSASVMTPLTDSMGGLKDAPQQNSGPALDNQLIPQQNSKFGFENVSTKQDEIMQDLEDSILLERHNIDGEGMKDVNVVLEIGSQRSVDICHGEENMDQVPQVQHEAVDFGLESSELACDELKSGNPELQQTPAGAKTDTPQIMQSESIKDSGRDEITQN
ncbi:hypothetical protein TEA_021137 [Camellia sinensis var. sinensis]|uniref:AT hook motif-containing protein n=1 Tax=Camellia sinensis var. sinensis TaxID=542762 RepID=A0A4S4E710_CAMSN|nr:hypothetical protein TEA_021137 [Camellia sinensis var. sinensis]